MQGRWPLPRPLAAWVRVLATSPGGPAALAVAVWLGLAGAAVAPTAAPGAMESAAATAGASDATAPVAASDSTPPAAAAEETVAPAVNPREDMVLVPAGEFLMGSTDADHQARSNEKPQRRVYLPDFYIDQFEVTNIQYKRFIDATGYPAPPSWTEGHYAEDADFYPVVEVTWWDAMAYARWAGKRLPTEAEWEKAARGTDGRRYPWGDEYSSHLANTGRYFEPANAHLEGASPFGVVNMAGNAAEWTASVFEPYPELVAVLPTEFGGVDASGQMSRPSSDRLTPSADQPSTHAEPAVTPRLSDEEAALAREDSLRIANDPRRQFLSAVELQDKRPRVYRGGSINNYPRFLRCANREGERPKARWYNIGFRCAMDATPGPADPAGER